MNLKFIEKPNSSHNEQALKDKNFSCYYGNY